MTASKKEGHDDVLVHQQRSSSLFQMLHQIEIPNSLYFPQRLFRMLHDIQTRPEKHHLSQICSWHPNGTAFLIHKPDDFVKIIMPIYFCTQSKLVSFKRQLQNYGFQRISSKQTTSSSSYRGHGSRRGGGGGASSGPIGFHHKNFLRDQPHKCKNIQLKAKSAGEKKTKTVNTSKRTKPDCNPSSSPLAMIPGMMASSLKRRASQQHATSTSKRTKICDDTSCPKMPGNQRVPTPILLHQPHKEEGYTTETTCCSSSDDDDGDSVLDEIVSELLLGDDEDVMMMMTTSDEENQGTLLLSESFDNKSSSTSATTYAAPSNGTVNADMSWDPDVESLE